MLPDEDGFTVLEELKRRGVDTPVIVISAKQAVDDKVSCLNLGCDDYLTKPFAFSELLARINAIMRRNVRAGESTRLVQADVSVDLLKRTVTRAGRPVDLKSKEFSLLVYLMENAGQVVTRSMIMKKVWGYDFDPGTNIIDVYVCQLRDKLDREGEPRLIHTVRGSGYVFKKA
jgi:two-component system OmpR family response regulator